MDKQNSTAITQSKEIDYELYYIRLLKGEHYEKLEEMATCELDHYYESECKKYEPE